MTHKHTHAHEQATSCTNNAHHRVRLCSCVSLASSLTLSNHTEKHDLAIIRQRVTGITELVPNAAASRVAAADPAARHHAAHDRDVRAALHLRLPQRRLCHRGVQVRVLLDLLHGTADALAQHQRRRAQRGAADATQANDIRRPIQVLLQQLVRHTRTYDRHAYEF